MKQIINGKRYDTETTEKVVDYWSGHSKTDFIYYNEELYRTKNGSYFLAGEGGPMTRYSELIPTGGVSGGSRIIPMDQDLVIEWLERTENYSILEQLFPESIKDV